MLASGVRHSVTLWYNYKVCIVSLCSRSLHFVMNQPFSTLHLQKANQHGGTMGCSRSRQAKNKYIKTLTEQPQDASRWKYFCIFCFSGRPALSLGIPFNEAFCLHFTQFIWVREIFALAFIGCLPR